MVSTRTSSLLNSDLCLISGYYRQHKLYNKELYADFIAAQIKTLSFLAYIIRIYQVLCLLEIDLLFKSVWHLTHFICNLFLVWLLNLCVCTHLVRIWLGSILSRWWKGCCSCSLTVLLRPLTCAKSCWSPLSTSSPQICAAVSSPLHTPYYTMAHSHAALTLSALFLLTLHEQHMLNIWNCG